MAKKKEAHHGGAWKVAYADFVTAMMALFMVLWITAQDKEILIATSQYFKQPFNALTAQDAGVVRIHDGGSQGSDRNRDTTTAANLAFMKALAKELNRMLNVEEAAVEKPVEIEVTSDGLRITLFDRNKTPLFENDTAKFTEWGESVLQSLAWIVDRNRLRVIIDGHTQSGTPEIRENYGPWELSTDRANAARRLLQYYAVAPEMIERVTGYGDTCPLAGQSADAEANRRITLSLSAAGGPIPKLSTPYAKLP